HFYMSHSENISTNLLTSPVQQVTLTEDATYVCTKPRTKSTKTFWEAWPLPGLPDVSVTDTASLANPTPSRGVNVSEGIVKFFCLKEPLESDPNWGIGKVKEALTLLSTPDPPSWWGDPTTEKQAKRTATSKWD